MLIRTTYYTSLPRHFHRPFSTSRPLLQNILVAYDGSNESKRALLETKNFYHPGDKIFVCHVTLPNYKDEILNEKRKVIEEVEVDFKNHFKNVQWEVVEKVGGAGTELVDECHNRKIDYLILGGKAINSLQQVTLSSLALYVVKNAPCSVVVVKDSSERNRGRDFKRL